MDFNSNPFWSDPSNEDSRVQRVLAGVREHVKDKKKLLFIVIKSWNDNVVLYEFCETNGIKTSWLSLEPADAERHRKNGNTALRGELNPAEQELFGSSVKVVEGNRYLIKINQPQLSTRTFEMVIDAKNNPAILGDVNGTLCKVEYAYVQMKRGLMPEADYMKFYGRAVENGSLLCEKIV